MASPFIHSTHCRSLTVTAPQSTPATVSCPRCRAGNRADVRFCGSCGAPLQASAPPSPPPFTPPQPPTQRASSFPGSGGSASQGSVTADASTTFNIAAQAITAAGGQVILQSPPQSMRVAITRKDFANTSWMKVKFAGDIVITPAGSRQSTVHVRYQAENLMTIVGTSVAVTLFAVMLNAQTGLGGLMLLVGIAATAWTAYNLSNNLPRSMAEKLVLEIQMQAQSGATPIRQTAAPASQPAPPRAQPNMSSNGSMTDGSGVVANMRKLQELRDMGALTAAEFEAKKTEILKRL
jgi:Short C-terminal domain